MLLQVEAKGYQETDVFGGVSGAPGTATYTQGP